MRHGNLTGDAARHVSTICLPRLRQAKEEFGLNRKFTPFRERERDKMKKYFEKSFDVCGKKSNFAGKIRKQGRLAE